MTTRTALVIAALATAVLAWVTFSPSSRFAPPLASAPSGQTVASPAAASPAPTPGPAAAAPAAAAAAPTSPDLSAEAPSPRPAGAATVQRSPGALRGSLRDAAGRPLAGVPVVAVAADGTDAGEDVTDDDGRWLLVALRPGRYAVFAGLGTPLASRVGARGADVEPAAVTTLALAARGPGATVRVLPLDAAGHAAPAQALLVPAALSAPRGLAGVLASDAILLPGASQTVVEGVPPGRYTVVILSGERTVRTPADVEVGERDVEVEVRLAPEVVSAL